MPRAAIMGVAGCDKSSVGEALVARPGVLYFDGDDLHPAATSEKTSKGIALTDDDRWSWLDKVATSPRWWKPSRLT